MSGYLLGDYVKRTTDAGGLQWGTVVRMSPGSRIGVVLTDEGDTLPLTLGWQIIDKVAP